MGGCSIPDDHMYIVGLVLARQPLHFHMAPGYAKNCWGSHISMAQGARWNWKVGLAREHQARDAQVVCGDAAPTQRPDQPVVPVTQQICHRHRARHKSGLWREQFILTARP